MLFQRSFIRFDHCNSRDPDVCHLQFQEILCPTDLPSWCIQSCWFPRQIQLIFPDYYRPMPYLVSYLINAMDRFFKSFIDSGWIFVCKLMHTYVFCASTSIGFVVDSFTHLHTDVVGI